MALVRVEVRRLLHRRLLWTLLAASVAALVVAAIIVFFTHHDRTETRFADVFQGQQFALRRYRGFRLTSLWEHHGGVLGGLAGPFLVLAVVVAASSIGAEWRAGTIGVQLTWESRRLRVFVAKWLVAAVAAAAIVVVLNLLVVATLLPSAVWRGTTSGADSAWWRSVFGMILRTGAMAMLAATAAFAVTSVGRNTAAALGAGFVYLAIVENFLRPLIKGSGHWLAGPNAVALVSGHGLWATVDPELGQKTVVRAALLLVLYAVALLGASAALFERRDVT